MPHGQAGPRPPDPSTRFPPPSGYQDLWAALLYAACSASVLGLTIWFASYIKQIQPGNVTLEAQPKAAHYVAFGISVVATTLAAVAYIALVKRYTEIYIKFCFWASAVVFMGAAILLFLATGSGIMIVFGVVFAIVFIVCWFIYRKRIPFAAVLLNRSTKVISKFPATIFATLLGSLCSIVYTAIVFVGVAGAFVKFGASQDQQQPNSKPAPNPGHYLVSLFYLFNLYWTWQIIMNTIHVTVAGLFATHYFQQGSAGGIPSNPTARAAKRALTVSFGSICYGSLIVAAIKLLRAMVRDGGRDEGGAGAFLVCIVDCLLSCLQGIIEFLNTYAFVQVAIYGKPFCVAARDTWTLIKDRGFEVIVNDGIIGTALSIGALSGGAVSALACSAVLGIMRAFGETELGYSIFVICLSFFAGTFIYYFVTVPLETGTQTLMVCIAEDPSIIHRNDPEFWGKVRETYPDAAFRGIT